MVGCKSRPVNQGGAKAAYRPPHFEWGGDVVKRDYRDYLQDILEAIDESTEFTNDISFEMFVRDRRTVNAVVRSLEVMGGAATRIPDHLRSRAPGVPWKYMALECATN